MAMEKRVTITIKNPNPLFEKWITEWRDKAIETDSKLQYCYATALQSLKKYPLPLESGRDCKILKGFGEKLCKMLEEKLIEHQRNLITEKNSLNKKNTNKTSTQEHKEYIPAHRSGAYAILVILYKKTLGSNYSGYALKTDIIKDAKHLCDKSFVKPEPGSYYTAWSSMKTLLDKKLVIKTSSPAKFSLSKEGRELAQKLYKTENGESEIDNFPSTSSIKNSPRSQSIANVEKESAKASIKNNKKSKKQGTLLTDKQQINTECASQNETFIFSPHTFEIILLIDKQEVAGSSQDEDPLLSELAQLNVAFETRHLKVGDYTWICRQDTSKELVLPYIIERKRMDDFASSIKDGRFHEQKFRLKQCGIENVIYLIESHGSNSHVGLPISNLYQAATNTCIQDNFSIKFTRDLKATVQYLSSLTSILQRNFQTKTVVSCPKENLNKIDIKDDLVSLMTFAEFNKNASKSRNFKVQELFIRQLLQLKGMSVEKALAIAHKYPTPTSLFLAYDNVSEAFGETLLASIQFGTLNKKIGPVISKVIYQLFRSSF